MLKLTDDGGKKILDVFFGDAPAPTSYYLELFTDSNPLADTDGGGSTRTLAAGGGYAELDMSTLATAAQLIGGIPVIEWEDAVFTFTGPLTGNPAIKGYAVIMDNVVIFEELLLNGAGVAAPYTPVNNGDILRIALAFQLGNGTPA